MAANTELKQTHTNNAAADERNDFMPDLFNLTNEMSAYFNSLPKSVQSALIYSGAKANSLADLKQLVEGFTGNGTAEKE